MQTLADVFKALGDDNRLKILNTLLVRGECCACVLLSTLEISQPTLSHHMKILCDSGLVLSRRGGKNMHYRVNREVAEQMRKGFSEVLEALDAIETKEENLKDASELC
ncbi:MAG: helix-turn-helix transcriptional regulator [Spirochaetales bacterium]|nr:helix-turn-helix transcriptional regulator [Candidatus Physcosoma equi]